MNATVRLPVLAPARPTTRADCRDGPRPCPWVGCRHHLYLEVTDAGAIKLTYPDVGPDELHRLPATCALDVAEAGRLVSARAVSHLLGGITPRRVRQIMAAALAHLESPARALLGAAATLEP